VEAGRSALVLPAFTILFLSRQEQGSRLGFCDQNSSSSRDFSSTVIRSGILVAAQPVSVPCSCGVCARETVPARHPIQRQEFALFCCPSARFSFFLKYLPPFLGFDFLDCEWIVAGESVLLLSYRIEKLEFSEFQSLSRGAFLNISARCSVKYLR
jgi:hypothetical protein